MPLDNISELKRRIPGGKYVLTRAVAERARQLQSGDMPLVEVRTPNPLSVAIDEIVQGKVSFHFDETPEEEVETEAGAEALTTEAETAEPEAGEPEAADATSDGVVEA